MTRRHDPEGHRLPIKIDPTSNGEYVPVPLDATNRAAPPVQTGKPRR